MNKMSTITEIFLHFNYLLKMMKMEVNFCLIYYVLIISFCHTTQVIEDEQTTSEETVEVYISPIVSRDREKRSEDNFPDLVNVLVKSAEPIILRLHRVTRSSFRPVILSATNHGLYDEDIPELNKENAFYQNVTNMAAVTLIKQDGSNHAVRGSFMKDGFFHTLEPVTQKESENDNIHRLTTIEQSLDFTGDEIFINDTLERSRVNRYRRQAGEETNTSETNNDLKELYLEYVIVIDYESYKIWIDKQSDNMTVEDRDKATKLEIIQFYRHTTNGIDVIFKSAGNEDTDLHVVLTGMVICNESGSSSWMDRHRICNNCTEVDDQRSLMGFYQWREKVLLQRLKHDHAALFTGYNLYHTEMASKSTVGVSYVGTVCENWSVSIMEARGNALSIHTAAHELGHSFGSFHDGTGSAEACLGTEKHVMQPKMSRILNKSKAHNPWTFSPCSINSIMDYLDNLDANDKNCLLNKPKLLKKPEVEPGLLYSADTQCQAMFGFDSSVCRTFHHHDWSSLCYGLACRNTETGICTSVLPYDGTACGYNKWCQQGLCVYNEAALDVPDLCPIGDDPHYVCTTDKCVDVDIHNGTCCMTCKVQPNQLTPRNTTTSINTVMSDISNITVVEKGDAVNTTQEMTTVKTTNSFIHTTESRSERADTTRNDIATTDSITTTQNNIDTKGERTESISHNITEQNTTNLVMSVTGTTDNFLNGTLWTKRENTTTTKKTSTTSTVSSITFDKLTDVSSEKMLSSTLKNILSTTSNNKLVMEISSTNRKTTVQNTTDTTNTKETTNTTKTSIGSISSPNNNNAIQNTTPKSEFQTNSSQNTDAVSTTESARRSPIFNKSGPKNDSTRNETGRLTTIEYQISSLSTGVQTTVGSMTTEKLPRYINSTDLNDTIVNAAPKINLHYWFILIILSICC